MKEREVRHETSPPQTRRYGAAPVHKGIGHYGPPITLDQAKKAMAAAEAKARQNNWDVVISIVDSGGHPCRECGVSKRCRGAQRSELNALGVGREPGQRRPELKRLFVGGRGVGEMVGPVQPGEAQTFHRLDDPLPPGPGQPVLPFHHNGDVHPCMSRVIVPAFPRSRVPVV